MVKRRQDEEAEILARATQQAKGTTHGPSILDIMWAKLDELTAQLMKEYPPERGPRDEFGDITRCYGLRGNALGVAWSIAVLVNPYDPNVDAVREEAMERYEARPRQVARKRPTRARNRSTR